MTLVEHLEELRWRLIKGLVAVVAGFALCFTFSHNLILLLSRPAQSVHAVKFIFTSPGEYFMSSVKVSFFAGLYLALPIILYQLIAFLAPGLSPKERNWIAPITFGSFLLFTLGAVFAYFAILPTGLHFLLTFAPSSIQPMLSIGTYIGFAAALLFASGLAFELPLVLLALSWVGLVSSKLLSRFRQFAWVATLVVGAIITPSVNGFSQVMLAGALIILYEFSIWLIRFTGR